MKAAVLTGSVLYEEFNYDVEMRNGYISLFDSRGVSAISSAQELYTDFPDQTFLLEEYDVDMISPNALENASFLYKRAMIEALKEKKSIYSFLKRSESLRQNGRTNFRMRKIFPKISAQALSLTA
ncbi:MAG: hypothetical protein ACI4SF_15415 [Oscillospiraceae bacterium]